MARTVRNYICPVCGKDCSKVRHKTWVTMSGKTYQTIQTVRTKAYKGVATETYIHTTCYEQIKRGNSQPKGGEHNER